MLLKLRFNVDDLWEDQPLHKEQCTQSIVAQTAEPELHSLRYYRSRVIAASYLLGHGEVGGIHLSGHNIHVAHRQQLRQQDVQLMAKSTRMLDGTGMNYKAEGGRQICANRARAAGVGLRHVQLSANAHKTRSRDSM